MESDYSPSMASIIQFLTIDLSNRAPSPDKESKTQNIPVEMIQNFSHKKAHY